MLRRARWIILLAIAVISGAVYYLFRLQKSALRRTRPVVSAPLPANTSSSAAAWEWEFKSGDKAKVRIRSRRFEQIKEPSTFLLEGLEMEIHSPDGKRFDLIRSDRASFDQNQGSMYSEGAIEITKGLPNEGEPAGRLMKIRTSGATFEVKTARVSTDRKTEFEFDRGGGECVGAFYDSTTRELLMRSQVKLDWRGADTRRSPMHLETGHLTYRESSGDIFLAAPASLRRDTFVLEAADTAVKLVEGRIDRVDAQHARGSDKPRGRTLDYSADNLIMHFTPKGEVTAIEAHGNARLASASPSGTINVTAARFDLEFNQSEDSSTLKRALASGNGRMESVAAPRPGAQPQGPRVLTSETIELIMRPGGKEIERVATHAPGHLDFLPAKKGDRRRALDGTRLTIDYAPGNALESFRAVQASTRTESENRAGKPVVSTTKSRDLLAAFDPRTGQMVKLEQWGDFQFEEMSRRATAGHATLDTTRDLITLRTNARSWDETGSTSADELFLDQQSGDLIAQGNVTSTRLPDKKQPAAEGMLSSSEPIQARAKRMAVTERNQLIRYEGGAVLWQSDSRLQADTVFIDRRRQQVEATGNVVSELPDRKPKQGASGFAVVKAPSLVYSDKDKLAIYAGGVTLDRPGMNVKARQIRAWFVNEPKKGGGEETRLDRMFADGSVAITETAREINRSGSSEHAEYYLADERVILTGGNPVVVDSKRGTVRGSEITWYSRQDRLVVDNTGEGPAVSRIKRK